MDRIYTVCRGARERERVGVESKQELSESLIGLTNSSVVERNNKASVGLGRHTER